MEDKKQNKKPVNKAQEKVQKTSSNKDEKGKEGKSDEFFERWKNESDNNMGNDIASEIKIANSNGHLEGGADKRWHIDKDEEFTP
jgi:hypothetical protein